MNLNFFGLYRMKIQEDDLPRTTPYNALAQGRA